MSFTVYYATISCIRRVSKFHTQEDRMRYDQLPGIKKHPLWEYWERRTVQNSYSNTRRPFESITNLPSRDVHVIIFVASCFLLMLCWFLSRRVRTIHCSRTRCPTLMWVKWVSVASRGRRQLGWVDTRRRREEPDFNSCFERFPRQGRSLQWGGHQCRDH